jgi:hypothetical protein
MSWDDWQKLVCILGDAGTGKSVIGGILKDFVPANMSATLSMNAQEEFGLATTVGPQGPLRTIMFECSGDVKIPAQQFQSMSTGEPVTINIKNKDAYSCDRWPVHVLLIGNTKPPWEDNGFALARRLVVFYMRKVVTQKDGRLASRIIADTLGASLFKYSLLYRDAVSHYRVTDPLEKDPHRTDGRAVFPPTIMRFNDSIRTTMNPLYKMLYDGLSSCEEPLFLSPNNNNVFMPLDQFGQLYNDYCTKTFRNMKRQNFCEDVYNAVFNQFGIAVRRDAKMFDRGNGRGAQMVEGNFVFGIGLVAHYAAEADEQMRQQMRQRRRLLAQDQHEGDEGDEEDYGDLDNLGDLDDSSGHDEDEVAGSHASDSGDRDHEDEDDGGSSRSRRGRRSKGKPSRSSSSRSRLDQDGVDTHLQAMGSEAVGAQASLSGTGTGTGTGTGPRASAGTNRGALWTEFLDALGKCAPDAPETELTHGHLTRLMRIQPIRADQLLSLMEHSMAKFAANDVVRLCATLRNKLL